MNHQIRCMGNKNYELNPTEICRKQLKYQFRTLLVAFRALKTHTNCQFKVAAFTYFLIFFFFFSSLDYSRAIKAASLQRTESLAICSQPFFSFPPNCSLLASSSPRSLILLRPLRSDWSPCLNTFKRRPRLLYQPRGGGGGDKTVQIYIYILL